MRPQLLLFLSLAFVVVSTNAQSNAIIDQILNGIEVSVKTNNLAYFATFCTNDFDSQAWFRRRYTPIYNDKAVRDSFTVRRYDNVIESNNQLHFKFSESFYYQSGGEFRVHTVSFSAIASYVGSQNPFGYGLNHINFISN